MSFARLAFTPYQLRDENEKERGSGDGLVAGNWSHATGSRRRRDRSEVGELYTSEDLNKNLNFCVLSQGLHLFTSRLLL